MKRAAEDRTYIYELLAKTINRIADGKPLVFYSEPSRSGDVADAAYVVQAWADSNSHCRTYRQPMSPARYAGKCSTPS